MIFKTSTSNTERQIAALRCSDRAIMIADNDRKIVFMNDSVVSLLTAAEPDLRTVIGDFKVDGLIGSTIDRFHKNPNHQSALLSALSQTHRATINVGHRNFDLSAHPLFDSKGKRMGTTVEWADAAERIANIQFKAVSDAISRSQAVIEFEPSGLIVNANENFLKTMGYELHEIVGKNHRMFVDADYAASDEYVRFWSDLRQGKFNANEFKRIGKNSKEVWIQASYNPVFDEKGHVTRVVKFASDVTASKLENANLLGQIQAIHNSQAVIEFGLDGTILTANDNFLKTTGYSLPEIQGKHHRLFVTQDENSSPSYHEFWQALGRGEYRSAQFKRLRKDGHVFYIQATYNAILDLNGKPWKVVKFAHDITREHNEKLKAEKERGELISAVASGAEELNSSIQEIAETMTKSRDTADQAASCVQQADRLSQQFSENAKATVGIVELIANITDQINLLALNATIESARAGEAGRGFAVVASEVKSLANQVKSASTKISAEISAMQASSADVVSALTAVKKEIDVVHQYVSSTAAAVQEQGAVAHELSAMVQRAVAQR